MRIYRVMPIKEAKELNPEEFDYLDEGYWDLALQGLFVCDENGKPIKDIFIDGIEPEDAIISRDLTPLVNEILKLAEENRKLQEENERLQATLEEVRDWPDSM